MNEHLATMYRDSQRELHAENASQKQQIEKLQVVVNDLRAVLAERKPAIAEFGKTQWQDGFDQCQARIAQLEAELARLRKIEQAALEQSQDVQQNWATPIEKLAARAEIARLRTALQLWLLAHRAWNDHLTGKISVTEREDAYNRALVATVDALSQGEESDAGR